MSAWVISGRWRKSGQCPLYPRKRTSLAAVFLYYPGGRQTMPKLRAFIDHVKRRSNAVQKARIHQSERANPYPEVEVELSANEHLIDMAAEGFDAGIRLGQFIAADMIAVRLTPPFPFVVVAS